jgi:hypothetical protein
MGLSAAPFPVTRLPLVRPDRARLREDVPFHAVEQLAAGEAGLRTE